ncbi:hypothetical protein CRM22_010019, partial [Opisthorchis felineus]
KTKYSCSKTSNHYNHDDSYNKRDCPDDNPRVCGYLWRFVCDTSFGCVLLHGAHFLYTISVTYLETWRVCSVVKPRTIDNRRDWRIV